MGNSQLKIFKVEGNSMNPLFYDGDLVSVMPIPKYKMGDIVVAIHPIQTDLTIIKQVEAIINERFRLRGTNPKESSDHFGLVPKEKILGKVVGRKGFKALHK